MVDSIQRRFGHLAHRWPICSETRVENIDLGSRVETSRSNAVNDHQIVLAAHKIFCTLAFKRKYIQHNSKCINLKSLRGTMEYYKIQCIERVYYQNNVPLHQNDIIFLFPGKSYSLDYTTQL